MRVVRKEELAGGPADAGWLQSMLTVTTVPAAAEVPLIRYLRSDAPP